MWDCNDQTGPPESFTRSLLIYSMPAHVLTVNRGGNGLPGSESVSRITHRRESKLKVSQPELLRNLLARESASELLLLEQHSKMNGQRIERNETENPLSIEHNPPLSHALCKSLPQHLGTRPVHHVFSSSSRCSSAAIIR